MGLSRDMPFRSLHRRMSLGWRLGLSTAIIVALVTGILTFVQQWREIRRDWKDRDTMRKLGQKTEGPTLSFYPSKRMKSHQRSS